LDCSRLEKATQIIAPILISTEEAISMMVIFSPNIFDERTELNTRVSEDTELTVIISAIDRVPIQFISFVLILTN
jgi:hypothetical protein